LQVRVVLAAGDGQVECGGGEIGDTDQVPGIGLVMALPGTFVGPKATSRKHPGSLELFFGTHVTHPVLSGTLLRFSGGVVPEQHDVNLGAGGGGELRIEFHRRAGSGSNGKKCCVNRFGIAVDGDDRFMFFGLSRASEHFQLAFAETNFTIHHHQLTLGTHPDIDVLSQSSEIGGQFTRQFTPFGLLGLERCGEEATGHAGEQETDRLNRLPPVDPGGLILKKFHHRAPGSPHRQGTLVRCRTSITVFLFMTSVQRQAAFRGSRDHVDKHRVTQHQAVHHQATKPSRSQRRQASAAEIAAQQAQAAVATLAWGEAAQLASSSQRISEQLQTAGSAAVQTWLDEVKQRRPDIELAGEAIACCHWWPLLSDSSSTVARDALWQALTQLVDRDLGEATRFVTLEQQLLSGELPLLLATLSPTDARCQHWVSQATRTIATGLVDSTDGEGLPRAELLSEIRPLFASWTRSLRLLRTLASFVAMPPTDNIKAQFAHLTLQLLRLTRWDYSPIFAPTVGAHSAQQRAVNQQLWEEAVDLAGDEARQLAAWTFGSSTMTKKHSATSSAALPTEYSETARVASMRSSWEADDEIQLALAFPDRRVNLELNSRRRTLWSGAWQAEVRLDGRQLQPAGDWEEVCWLSDEQSDYLELSLPLTEGFKLERQILFVREAGSVYLADTVAGERAGRIEYHASIPLGASVGGTAASDTRECALRELPTRPQARTAKQPLALILPLYLPEWRAQSAVGGLSCEAGRMEWSHAGDGVALCAPLWITADRSLMKRDFTWRTLTVAENLQPIAADVAVGYRVQFASRQWLVYRTLSRPGSRSLLGQNVMCDFLAARFNSNGTRDALVEIE
jgi:hypothetical protein